MEWELARECSERADGAVERFLMKQLEHAQKQAEVEGHSEADTQFAEAALKQWNHYCVVGDFPEFLKPLHHAILHKEPIAAEFLIYEPKEEEEQEVARPTSTDPVSPIVGDSQTILEENRMFEYVRPTEGATLEKKQSFRGDMEN